LASRRWRTVELPNSDIRPAPSESAGFTDMWTLLLITSLEAAGPSGKSAVGKFRRNFIVYLRSRLLCRSLKMRGKGETP
jgi:hypothetical protein